MGSLKLLKPFCCGILILLKKSLPYVTDQILKDELENVRLRVENAKWNTEP
jgi:hypothetical protein